MELSSITDKLVQNIQRAQSEQIVTVTKVLGLKVGSQFLADVQKVTQATQEERAQLIKSIEGNLAQLNKNSAAPAIKALITELEAQKSIAQIPSVKLVTLSVNAPASVTFGLPTTPTPATPLTTLLAFTNQPIQLGQTLLMQLGDGQRLQLLQPLTKAEVVAFNAPLKTSNEITAPTANVNISTNLQLSTGATLNNQLSTEAIGETLRRLLPQKDKGENLLASVPKITQFIQQLPIAERKEWLSSQIQQSLKTVANHIRSSDQLTNPKLVEMTLKNNGQNFEHKLAQFVISPKSSTSVTPLLITKNSTPATNHSLTTNQNSV